MRANQYNILRSKAWILFLVFMFPFVLKAFHRHEAPACCHRVHHESTSDPVGEEETPGDDCFICHFTYSFFISAENVFTGVVISIYSFYLPVFPEAILNLRLPACQLRGPPF
ncbi:MAG: hypothetical protein LUG98_15025 [Tannerellaceae bacterium]|nr:hypothetical protein [Tannerellaceae bacterium]